MGITLFKKFKKENLDINRIFLDKTSIYSGTIVKISSKLVTETGLYDKEELEEQIKIFLAIMVKNFPTFPIDRFKENFATLNINNLVLKYNFSCYLNDGNSKSINILNKEAFFHEMLHFASDKNYIDKVMIGFEYSNEKYKRLGRGLNECYTELICSRYFSSIENMVKIMSVAQIAYRLEEVIGRQKMGDLYFNGNLFDIVRELIKLSSEEESIQFILDFDEFYDVHYSSLKTNTLEQNKELINNLSNKLLKFIDKCLEAKNNINKKSSI